MSVLVIAESGAAGVASATRQAVTAAAYWGTAVDLLLIGSELAEQASLHAGIAGVRSVLVADAPQFANPLAEDVARLLDRIAADYAVLLSAHTALARSVLPRVAALRGVGMVSDVLEILGADTYLRPVHAGNLLATVENRAGLQILSVRAARFAPAALGGQAACLSLAVPEADGRSVWLERHSASDGRPELGSARVVVSGGRSLGSAESFHACLGPLADRLGGALGATRAAVDAGIAPNEWQVGQTGCTVAPDLYIALGLSGAQQHMAGIKDSKVIVAINHDADAPIMQLADYTLVADIFEAVPEWVRSLDQGGPLQ